jgi:hypothetical protein
MLGSPGNSGARRPISVLIIAASFVAGIGFEYAREHVDLTRPAVKTTPVAELPALAGSGSCQAQWAGAEGLHVVPVAERRAVAAQEVLKLVAVPTNGFHRIFVNCSGLAPAQLYRITVWLKGIPSTCPFIEMSNGQADDYGRISYFLGSHERLEVVDRIEKEQIADGPFGWKAIGASFYLPSGDLRLAIGLHDAHIQNQFLGDGRLTMLFGGVTVEPDSDAATRAAR